MSNPLLTQTDLPHFDQILPEHVQPAILELLVRAKKTVQDCLLATSNFTWENLVAPIEHAEDDLNKAWSPVSHLNAVMNNEQLREE